MAPAVGAHSNGDLEMTHAAYKIVLTLDCVSDEPFVARATTIHNPDPNFPDTLELRDCLEHENLDVLREMFKSNGLDADVTHYRTDSGNDYTGGWSDALSVAKEREFKLSREAGASEVRRNMSLRHLVEARFAAKAAADERARLDAERDAEKERARIEREHRAAEREDFDVWSSIVRAARDEDSSAHALAVTMRWAYNEVDNWSARLAEHVKALTESPLRALSWSGEFVQQAANFQVATHVVDLFEAGVSVEEIEREIMSAMFNKADRATSRSTSVMSNVTEDCIRVAYTEAAKRISGRSFW